MSGRGLDASTDVVVVGGAVIGCGVAWRLARTAFQDELGRLEP